MVDTEVIGNLTIEAFRKNAIRSVLLMDERFPKYYQVGTDDYDTSDAAVCRNLYKEFNDQGLLCDVENDAEKLKHGSTSQIQKSDLLILDLHLNKENESDISDSMEILKALADSDQFNLVIIYTATPELDRVGRQVAGSLVKNDLDIKDQNILDEITLKCADIEEEFQEVPLTECVDSFLLRSKYSGGVEFSKFKGMVAKSLDESLREYLDQIIHQFAINSLKDEFGSIPGGAFPCLKAGNLSSTNPWFTCGSVFVVIANKSATPPRDGAILEVLDNALKDWNPGVVRCILSEIQNRIAVSAYHYDTSLGNNDAITQVGWLYHAKQESSSTCSRDLHAISELTDRVLSTLGSRITSDAKLVDLVENVLNAIELKQDPKERIEELCIANGVLDIKPKPSLYDVLHALNCFLSCEEVGKKYHYITTGTILKTPLPNKDEWWLCVEPDCDTVPAQAGKNRFIRLRMLRLQKLSRKQEVLTKATHSKYVFIEHKGDRIYLSSRDGTTNQLDLFDIYVLRDNQIAEDGDLRQVQFWKLDTTQELLSYSEGTATLVSQLRRANANRLLHEAGYHQSRIGVDFINCSDEDVEALKAPK